MHLAELMSRELEVDIREEEGTGAMDVKLSSFQISPISSNDVPNVDITNCTTLTDSEVDCVHSCVDQHLLPADDCHPHYNEADEKFTNAESVVPLCENPVTNLA